MPPADRTEPGRPIPSPRRRRWRKWLVFALVLLAIRLTLPLAVAPMLAARLSRALGTRVDIGDVSLQPIDAIITLRSVTVHAPAGIEAGANPPIVASRVQVDLQWLPLMHQKLELRELALESARVELDRFADGSFGLANLGRANPTAELPPGWSLALNRIALRDSQLHVRDLAAEGSALFDATLRNASISGIRRRPTAFGKAPNLHVDALVGGGRLRVRGRCELRDDGLVLDAQVRLKDVPLAHATPYVAELGWTDLAGEVSGQLRWQREPRRRDLLTGRAAVRRVRVQSGALVEPALEIRRGMAEDAAIDLVTRRITIGLLTVSGATLALRADGGAAVPLLTTAFSPPAAPRRGGARLDTEAPSRWHWMIKRFDTPDGRFRVLTDDGPVDFDAQASAENLGPGAYWSPLRIHARRDDVAAAFDGTARLGAGVVIEGRLTAAGIDFAALARAAALPWADLVERGRATADLAVQVDTAASDSYARGTISLADVWIAGPDPNVFAFGSTAIDLTLDRYEPREPPGIDGRGGQSARILFSKAQMSAPFLLLTRTTDGWILPPFAPVAEDGAETAAELPTPEAASAAPIAIDPTATAQATFESVLTGDGILNVVDLVPAANVIWEVTGVHGSASRLSLPTFLFDDLQLDGYAGRFGKLYLGGSRGAGDYQFLASGDGVALTALTPYLRGAGVPYSFAAGTAGFSAHGVIAAERWNADAALALQDFTLVGNEALETSLGMPVSDALAMLRDESGATMLELVLASPPSPGTGTLADQVVTGIRSTIRRVAETDQARHLPIVTLRFSPGQALFVAAAMREIQPIAELLASRPDLVVEVSGGTSEEDRRWLAEQALLPALEDRGGGFMGMLRALGMQDARARIRAAITARTHGDRKPLSAADEALLTRMLAEAPPVTGQQLAGLREARLSRVVDHLSEQYGLGTPRVVVRRTAGDDDLAAVKLQVGIAPDAVVPDVQVLP